MQQRTSWLLVQTLLLPYLSGFYNLCRLILIAISMLTTRHIDRGKKFICTGALNMSIIHKRSK